MPGGCEFALDSRGPRGGEKMTDVESRGNFGWKTNRRSSKYPGDRRFGDVLEMRIL